MTFAVVRLGGRQFKVKEGDVISLERQENAEVDVLLYSQNEELVLGTPVLTDYHVVLEKIEDSRAKKIRIGRFKSKSRYRKIKGHRQPISKFKVVSIGKGTAKVKKTEEKEIPIKEVKKEESKPVKEVKKETVKKAPVKKEAAAEPKKRGRPAKSETKVTEAPKKRGRPKKEENK